MVETDEVAPRVERDPDRVEAKLLQAWAVAAFHEPSGGYSTDLPALVGVHRLERVPIAARQPAALDLDEDQSPPVGGDQIDLAPPRPEVPLQDGQPGADEMLRSEALARGTE